MAPDWLLIYRRDDMLQILSLVRTGSHSDLLHKSYKSYPTHKTYQSPPPHYPY
ncbi:MAG: type II toxin-antitoxin system YafQ family toxin [Muribaculaceae bacterium]|nr:type II toxin-antitoxin system YafQ family toxin [Muribaculaceae bacterium]